MNTPFTQEMKTKLAEERADLLRQLDAISSKDVGDHVPGERAATFPNYGDDALNADSESPTEVADYSVNVDVTGTLSDRLALIDAALKRIEEGTYGTCVKCGTEIAAERLQANPSADTCIECARAHV